MIKATTKPEDGNAPIPAEASNGKHPQPLAVAVSSSSLPSSSSTANASEPSADAIAARDLFQRHETEFSSYHAGLVRSEQEAGREYDKWLLTLSGTALGFSLTLVKDFIGTAKPLLWVEFLRLSWVLFAISVVLILINLHLSYTAFGKFKKRAEDEYRSYSADVFERINQSHRRVYRVRVIPWFNVTSLISFVLGLVSMAVFISNNS